MKINKTNVIQAFKDTLQQFEDGSWDSMCLSCSICRIYKHSATDRIQCHKCSLSFSEFNYNIRQRVHGCTELLGYPTDICGNPDPDKYPDAINVIKLIITQLKKMPAERFKADKWKKEWSIPLLDVADSYFNNSTNKNSP